jgi:hypothetical protein
MAEKGLDWSSGRNKDRPIANPLDRPSMAKRAPDKRLATRELFEGLESI